MSDLQPKKATIVLGDKEYPMLFSLNVIDEIQDHFDLPISKLTDLLSDERNVFKSVKFILAALINEGLADNESDEKISEQFIGRKITPQNIGETSMMILKVFGGSIPEPSDDEIPNLKSE